MTLLLGSIGSGLALEYQLTPEQFHRALVMLGRAWTIPDRRLLGVGDTPIQLDLKRVLGVRPSRVRSGNEAWDWDYQRRWT